jgi:hypothetical protein
MTDQFLSVDPNLATTDQPYVFTNDDPLNSEDPLGLKGSPGTTCVDMSTKACNAQIKSEDAAIEKAVIGSLMLGFLGLSIDATSFGVEALGAVSDNPAISVSGTAIGFVGTAVSIVGCNQGGGLACLGRDIGIVATTVGAVESVLEAYGVAPGLVSLLQGSGFTLGGATASFDLAAVIVAIHRAVVKMATRIAK